MALRTEVSAQTGTTDVTPLFAGPLGLTALTSLAPSPFKSQAHSKDQRFPSSEICPLRQENRISPNLEKPHILEESDYGKIVFTTTAASVQGDILNTWRLVVSIMVLKEAKRKEPHRKELINQAEANLHACTR